MKVRTLLLFIALTVLSGTGDGICQKRKDVRLQSGKNLRNTLLTMIRKAKESSSKKFECDMRGLLKSIPKNKLVPSSEALKKEIGHIVDDSLKVDYFTFYKSNQKVLDDIASTTKKTEFLIKLGINYGDLDSESKKKLDRYYYSFRRAQKSGYIIHGSSIKIGECVVKIKTVLIPKKIIWGQKSYYRRDVDWEVRTDISIDCPCTKKNKFKVKKASYRYTAQVSGPLMFNRSTLTVRELVMYGLRFGEVKAPLLDYTNLECCKELKDPVEDGSFTDPNENINDKNTLLDTGLGVGFGSETETSIGFSGGVLFNVTEIGGNPLFVGPKASVSTTSITSDYIKELKVLIGPTVEYQIPLNSGNVNIITGVNSGYTFGNVDVSGFEQDFSGIAVNTYAGAQFNVGDNLAITALLNFFDFSNLTFKSDMENFENTTSNTTFLTDGGAINVGVRIGLD